VAASTYTSTTTDYHPSQLPQPDAAARHDGGTTAQLRRYDKPAGTAAATVANSPSYRQQYNHHRRHHEAWYRSPPLPAVVEGYTGALSPRGGGGAPEVVQHGALPVPVPSVFPPHLPLPPYLTPPSWKSAPGVCKNEAITSGGGVLDMTANRRRSDAVDTKCETARLDRRPLSDESAAKTTVTVDGQRQNATVRFDEDDRKRSQEDSATLQLAELPSDETSSDVKRRRVLTEAPRHPHHATMPSPPSLMLSGGSSTVEQRHERHLLGGGEVVVDASSPRRSYDNVQRRATTSHGSDVYFGLSTTTSPAGGDESPLDLTCQPGKSTSTRYVFGWLMCYEIN